jgi:glycosyltransferase involved in cell wall biosynthesis
VALLHALDGDALALTRRLAAAAELEYLAGVFCLRPDGHVAEARCRGVLAAGQPVLLALERRRAAAGQTFHLVRPGVYLARRAACFTDPQHAPALIAAGELRSFQPFAAVLKAFARLRAAGHEAVLFLVGGGRCERPLRRLGEKLGLRADLTFVDRLAGQPLNDILAGADVFIAPVPSHRVDIDLLSAMAGGVPALTAGAEACDFVIPDRTALTFAAGDAGELAARLTGLLEDRAFARGLAEAALAHLREHHSPARMAQQLAGIYRSVAAGRTPA